MAISTRTVALTEEAPSSLSSPPSIANALTGAVRCPPPPFFLFFLAAGWGGASSSSMANARILASMSSSSLSSLKIDFTTRCYRATPTQNALLPRQIVHASSHRKGWPVGGPPGLESRFESTDRECTKLYALATNPPLLPKEGMNSDSLNAVIRWDMISLTMKEFWLNYCQSQHRLLVFAFTKNSRMVVTQQWGGQDICLNGCFNEAQHRKFTPLTCGLSCLWFEDKTVVV